MLIDGVGGYVLIVVLGVLFVLCGMLLVGGWLIVVWVYGMFGMVDICVLLWFGCLYCDVCYLNVWF